MSLEELCYQICIVDSRYIFTAPRQVHYARKFTRSSAYRNHRTGIERLKNKIEMGEDISSHLSEKLPMLNVKARTSKSLNEVSDLLLETYGIYHLHIGSGRKNRGAGLVFACFGEGVAVFLDVRSKHDFSPEKLVKILAHEFSETGLMHRVNGVVGLSRAITSPQRKRLMMGGVNVPIEHKGAVYASTRGLSSAGYGINSVRRSDDVLRTWRALTSFEELSEHFGLGAVLSGGLTVHYVPPHFGIHDVNSGAMRWMPHEFCHTSPISAGSNG
ncbi:hypothetical protein [Phaeobacter inhibens]|uniref:hypothetical protein n=1 Tax=Phaeobacter inhibens TaxID=221822 RepID=UPI0021A91225|nr:hypothetical protein [Phaeobacter inhibens]UWR56090.1 hypothetical protein K4F89_13750 [Phaeobacter inhibens]